LELLQTILPWHLEQGHSYTDTAIYKPVTPILNWDTYDHITIPYTKTNGIITTRDGHIHITARAGVSNQVFKYDFGVSSAGLKETTQGGKNCDRHEFILPPGDVASRQTDKKISKDPALSNLWSNTKKLKNIFANATSFWNAFLANQPPTAYCLSRIGVIVTHHWGASIKLDLELLHKGSLVKKIQAEGKHTYFAVASNTSLPDYGLKITNGSVVTEINKIDLDTRYLLRDTNYSVDFIVERHIPV
jgi:hypothetical protein